MVSLRTAACVIACLLVPSAPAATADTVDHVHVNASGRNSTRSFSTALSVDVALVSGYARHSFDGDAGTWDGPGYHATLKPTLTGATHLDWGVTFELASEISAEDLAKRYALDIGSWRVLQQAPKTIPHVIDGSTVGSITGLMLLTQAPGDSAAAFSSAIAFPLCRGVLGVAHFSTLTPSSSTVNPFGRYVVDDGTDVQAWNRDHVTAALDGVVLNGYLPAARLTATVRRGKVQGVLRDCVGHPMPGVAVKVGTVRAVTAASGAYSARVRAGAYVVSATAGGGSVRRVVRVRAS